MESKENTQEGIQINSRKRSLIFFCLIVSGIASSTLSTAMTTALPNVVEYFGVSTSIGQWVTSGYSLAMGMVMPLTAYLITRFPTKKLYMTGIGVFLAGLLFSIFAWDFWGMMVGRVLQACGNGVLMSAAQVVILSVYPAHRRGCLCWWGWWSAPCLLSGSAVWKSLFWMSGSLPTGITQ